MTCMCIAGTFATAVLQAGNAGAGSPQWLVAQPSSPVNMCGLNLCVGIGSSETSVGPMNLAWLLPPIRTFQPSWVRGSACHAISKWCGIIGTTGFASWGGSSWTVTPSANVDTLVGDLIGQG